MSRGPCRPRPCHCDVSFVCTALSTFAIDVQKSKTAEEISQTFATAVRRVLRLTNRETDGLSFSGVAAAVRDVGVANRAAVDAEDCASNMAPLSRGLRFAAGLLSDALKREDSLEFVKPYPFSFQQKSPEGPEPPAEIHSRWMRGDPFHLGRHECAEILAAGLFGIIDRESWGQVWIAGEYRDMQAFTFRKLWGYDGTKWGGDSLNFVLMSVLLYFQEFDAKVEPDPTKNTGIIITRKVMREDVAQAFQPRGKRWRFVPFSVEPAGVSIHEDRFTGPAYLQVDFANEYLGGGVLNGGGTQEESMFISHPELLVTMYLVEKMLDFEAVEISGVKKIVTHNMQASRFLKRDEQFCRINENCNKTTTVALDAIPYSYWGAYHQYRSADIERELRKCLVGFSPVDDINMSRHIVTGLWGCGMYNGDMQLKFVIQWMAISLLSDAASRGRTMIFCPYSTEAHEELKRNQNLEELRVCIEGGEVTVEDVWRLLIDENDSYRKCRDTFQYLREKLERQVYRKMPGEVSVGPASVDGYAAEDPDETPDPYDLENVRKILLEGTAPRACHTGGPQMGRWGN